MCRPPRSRSLPDSHAAASRCNFSKQLQGIRVMTDYAKIGLVQIISWDSSWLQMRIITLLPPLFPYTHTLSMSFLGSLKFQLFSSVSQKLLSFLHFLASFDENLQHKPRSRLQVDQRAPSFSLSVRGGTLSASTGAERIFMRKRVNYILKNLLISSWPCFF